MISKTIRSYVAMFAFVFSLGVTTFAQAEPTSPGEFPGIDIKNFGKMDDKLFRGGQPEPDDYQAMKDLGITTIVDLRNDPTDYEKTAAETLGMKYINIPMSGWKYAKDSQVEEFMKVMNDPSSGVVYVHCKAGKHRTGLTSAVYRMEKYGWDYDTAYKEMKNYDYTSWPVHYNIKSYVIDYANRMKSRAPKSDNQVAAAQGVN